MCRRFQEDKWLKVPPPSAHAAAFQGGFNRLHQLLMAFLPSFKCSQIIFCPELFIVLNGAPSPASFKLSQPQNVRKSDFPMALLPDPTTAASERSSMKNRLRGDQKTRVRHKQAQVQNSQQKEFKRGQAHASPGGSGTRMSTT